MQISEFFDFTGGMKISRLKINAGISKTGNTQSNNQQENPTHMATPSFSYFGIPTESPTEQDPSVSIVHIQKTN
jgi:hypothetical protein